MNTGEPRYLSQGIDYLGFLEAKLRDLRGIATMVYELIQNADDVKDEEGQPGASRISFDVQDDALIVENDGVFREIDFTRMRKVAGGGKREEVGTTGAFGIGFIAVYQITDHPEIFSSGRHWIIHPEAPEQRRIEEWPVQTESTRFRLPWAFDPQSEARRKLRLEAIQPEQLPLFMTKMRRALSLAALFLKQVELLELKRSGILVKRIRRALAEDEILIQEGDQVLIWRISQGSFQDEATQLRRRYSWIEPKRHSDVRVAIPDELPDSGRLFAVLPSETVIPLPFHINADLFPSSDRKRIIFGDDYQSEWNRAAIRAAARALADDFDKLPGLLGHKGLWRLLERLDECRRQVSKGEPDRVFAAFWEEIAPSLRTRRIVFTTKAKWVAHGEARLLETDAEEAAAQILEALDVPIVHPDLRPYFGFLRQKEIGTPLLGVHDVVGALRRNSLDKQIPLTLALPCLRTVEDWRTLWGALDALLERRQTPETLALAKGALRSCAIALDAKQTLQLPANLFRGDAKTRVLFPDIAWMAEHTELDAMPGRLVTGFAAEEAVRFLSGISAEQLEASWYSGELDIEAVYHWFEERKSEILGVAELRDDLRALPLWPASGHLHQLSRLYIPGGFDDPLKLSTLIDLEALGGRREFLKDLGVQEFTFETYVREQVPRVLQERPDLPAGARKQLVQLLAQRLGEIRGDESVQSCLSQQPLIECTDEAFRPAPQVYAQSNVVDILGDHIHVAAPISRNTDAVQALYTWLGVAQEPRPGDVIQRIHELTANPPNDVSLQIVETAFEYLVSRWAKWDESRQRQYASLQDTAWLPGTGSHSGWYRPDELYAVFRAYLFQTQTVFLGLPRRLQDRAGGSGGLIEFLDIKTEPSPELVVRHLLLCSERGERVNREICRFLNEQADDSAIGRLRDRACLILPDDSYVRPDQVYWTEHPFGPFRYQLSPDSRQYSALFERLGVREHPENQDFIQVLLEIGEQYGQRHTPLNDQTHVVVMRCWEELSTALEGERITPDDLAELRGGEVIPDPRTQPLLAKPENLFFEDRAGLADKFQEFLKQSVIARPQGAWRAMEAVGVRRLSHVVKPHLLECEDPIDDQVLIARVKERRPLVARVVESERASGVDGLDPRALDRLQFRQARELMIQYSLQAFRQKRTTDSESVPALLIADEQTLFTVHYNGRIPWPAVARELAYAVKPIGEIGGLAGGIKEALATDSSEETCRTLDELGYPPLQERIDTEVAGTGVVSRLGGSEMTAEEAASAILGGDSMKRADVPEAPAEGPPGGGMPSDGGGKPPTTKRKRQSKLRTYVVGEGDEEIEGEPDTATAKRRSRVDQAGIHRVIEHEIGQGRTPTEMDHYHKGYDIKSCNTAGQERYIEVKSLSGDWGARNAAGLTKTQFEMARERGGQFWLYVVERATSDDCQIHRIQDPANQVNQYLFDDGWQALAETADGDVEELM